MSQLIACAVEPDPVYDFAAVHVVPLFDTRKNLTPLTSSRPRTLTVTEADFVDEAMSLIRTVPVGLAPSTTLPPATENMVTPSFATGLSLESSALLGLSKILLSGSV